jgi:hypothetical protein
MKQLSKLFCLLFVLSGLISCDTEGDILDVENTEIKSLELKSPMGHQLVESEEELKNLFISKFDLSEKNLTNQDVIIEKISYLDEDLYSIAFIDVNYNYELFKMMTVFSQKVELTFLHDDKNLIIIESSVVSPSNFDSESILTIKPSKSKFEKLYRSTFVCNGGCCEWSQPGPNAFHCGCGGIAGGGASPDPAPIEFTTSDGCVIQYLGG